MDSPKNKYLIIGALLGIASVYLMPGPKSSRSDDKSKKKDKCKPKQTTKDSGIESDEKVYSDSSVCSIIEMLKTEIMKIWSADQWKINIPRFVYSYSTSSSTCADTFHSLPNENLPDNSTQDIADFIGYHKDDSTEYNHFPQTLNSELLAGEKHDEEAVCEVHVDSDGEKVCTLRRNRAFRYKRNAREDNSYRNLRRQSTLINERSEKFPISIPLGEESINQLSSIVRAYANADTPDEKTTTQDRQLQVNLTKSNSPVLKLFRNVKNILHFKRKLIRSWKSASIKVNEAANNNNNNSAV